MCEIGQLRTYFLNQLKKDIQVEIKKCLQRNQLYTFYVQLFTHIRS